MKRRVVVTGLGVLAPNGIGGGAFAKALEEGKSGIGPITLFEPLDLKVKFAAEVKNFDAADYMAIATARKTDRFAQFGVAAARMAMEESGIWGDSDILENAGVIIGSGLGGSNFHEDMIKAVVEAQSVRKVAASSVPRITPNAVSAYIALESNIKGPNLVISTACSSGSQAIAEGLMRIASGQSDVIIAGGVDAPVSLVNMAMYEAMYVLGSPRDRDFCDASRPFDKSRNGFVMGEGAACLVLEDYETAKNRGASMYAFVGGAASNCGAYHMVAPNPSGGDAKDVMELALADAKVNACDVDYISAHGTSTKLNDVAETNAVKLLMGEDSKRVPVSSIKSMIGHTIGAAGAIQAVAACLSIKKSFIPPTINYKEKDPECDLDYVPNQARHKKIRHILSNSFGFGSNNCSIVFSQV